MRLSGLMAASLLAGDWIGDFGNGLLVLGLAGLAGFGFIGRSHPPTTSDEEREAWSRRLGNRLFLPALIIPMTALVGTLLYNYTPLGGYGLIEAKRETYVFLGLGVAARAGDHLRLAAAAGAGPAAGGQASDRRDRLGGGAAADARRAGRAVRRRRSRRR